VSFDDYDSDAWELLSPLNPSEPTSNPDKLQLQLAFEAFHLANPAVLCSIFKLVRYIQGQGWKRAGMKDIFERMRWVYRVQTKGDDYTLNNNYTAYYARVVMALDPFSKELFEVRSQKDEYFIDWGALNIDPATYEIGRVDAKENDSRRTAPHREGV